MITVYYMCGGYALNYLNEFLRTLKGILPNVEKKLVLITNDANTTIYDKYHQDNVDITVKFDDTLSIIPLNKVDELKKYINNDNEYSIFINPNAKFVGFDAELLEDNKLYFGYKYREGDEQDALYGFGSIIYGKTELFNQMINYAYSYTFVEDENRTDEQKFIRFLENNPTTALIRESSDVYAFFE